MNDQRDYYGRIMSVVASLWTQSSQQASELFLQLESLIQGSPDLRKLAGSLFADMISRYYKYFLFFFTSYVQ